MMNFSQNIGGSIPEKIVSSRDSGYSDVRKKMGCTICTFLMIFWLFIGNYLVMRIIRLCQPLPGRRDKFQAQQNHVLDSNIEYILL